MRIQRRILSTVYIFFFVFFLTSCGATDKANSLANKNQAAFDKFTMEVFRDEVTRDTLTLNYSLASPEKYGISRLEATFGDYSVDAMKKNLATLENHHEILQSFSYEELNEESQFLYDQLDYLYGEEKALGDYFLYANDVNPTTGIQTQLPILLAEYHFYDKESVDTYLALLEQVGSYFEDLIAFQKEKKKAGLFMTNRTANEVINQCKSFVSGEDSHYLISMFNTSMDSMDTLSDAEKKSYKQTNQKLVKEVVLPAYKSLMDALESLKSKKNNQGGLCGLPKGKEYYELYVKRLTGSNHSIEEMDRNLKQTLSASQKTISNIISKNPDCYYEATNVSYPSNDPEEILTILMQRAAEDFPELDDISYEIKYVDESLEDALSPAFYLSPAIDNQTENPIYINRKNQGNTDTLFTTLAHEGYPGHMYQNNYFTRQNYAPLRTLLSSGGYSEGFATYVEIYSYEYAGLSSDVTMLLQKNMISTLCVYALTDIGVHYHGWSKKETSSFLKKYGFSSDIITLIYDTMIADPGNYLKYTYGYLEIMELKNTAIKGLSSKYNEKSFHKFLLEAGPAPFPVLKQYLEKWMRNQINE